MTHEPLYTNAHIYRGKHMKKGDTLPDLRVKLLEIDNAYNLKDHEVTMRMKRTDGDSLIVDNEPVTIDDVNRGLITYSWSPDETDEAGTYLLEFVAVEIDPDTDAVIGELTFPNSGYARLYIEEELGT